jgi:hypothetical protein
MTWNELIKALQSFSPELLDKEVTVMVPPEDDNYYNKFTMNEVDIDLRGKLYLM